MVEVLVAKINSTFEFNKFQLTAFSLGGLSTEKMGIEYISGNTFVNYLIYGLFIFTMPIMFINIFQSISIGEIKNLYEDSEANEVRTKIEYVFFLEEIRQLNYFPCLKTFSYKLDRFIGCFNNILSKNSAFQKISKENFETNVKSKEKSLDKKLASLSTKISQLSSKTEWSEKKGDNRIEKMEQKIDKIEQLNFDKLNKKIDELNKMFLDEMERKKEKRNRKEQRKSKEK